MRLPSWCLICPILALGMLASCAVGPRFRRPTAPAGAGFTVEPLPIATASAPAAAGDAQRWLAGNSVESRWWESFGSTDLDALVQLAFSANPTIQSAQAALQQARELAAAQRGYYLPTIRAGYQFERQKLSGNTGGNSPGVQGDGTVISTYANPAGPAPYNAPVVYNFHTAQLTLGFVPDLFGANRRQVESLAALAEAQRFQLEAAYVSLAASVTGTAIQEAGLRAQLASARDIVAASERILEITRDREAQGFAMRSDVAAAQNSLAQARLLVPPLQRQLEMTRDQLRALAGKYANQELPQTFELARFRLPRDLPLTLPADIIEQRPDVRIAEAQLKSFNAQLGVAIANRLPQFAINGSAGGNAASFSQMFSSGGPFWSLVGSVSQTLFAGNTLLHEQRAAQSALRQAAADYQQTVIGAYQNVGDSLHTLIADAQALVEATAAEQAARRVLDSAATRSLDGYNDPLVELGARIALAQAHMALSGAQATRLGDTAIFFQVLGGGWWSRTGAADGQDRASRGAT